MNRPMGIVASYIDVVFKKDGKEIYKTQGSLGCVRHGGLKDGHDLVRQGFAHLQRDVKAGTACPEAPYFTSVVVGHNGQQEFSRTELVTAGVIPGKKPTKKPNTPKL